MTAITPPHTAYASQSLPLACLLLLLSLAPAAEGAPFKSVLIQIGGQAGESERAVASLLAERIAEPSGIPVRVADETLTSALPATELVILLGVPEHHAAMRAQFETRRIPPLTGLAPGPEGFLLETTPRGSGCQILAAGVDPRGVLYAAGEILRRGLIRESSFDFPASLTVRTAPAFEVRGTQFGQSSVARNRAKVRPWTEQDRRRAILDFALAGMNTVEVGDGLRADDPEYRLLKSFGLKTMVQYGPNLGDGPAEWCAAESIGRPGYLCPSVPAAREALIRRCEERFRDAAPVDYVRFYGGDGGGCECDRCKPYGRTFIRLCEDLAQVIHRYHPRTEIFVTNQKFDNEDDKAIFAYLQEKPRPWLRAFCYGPGSDAMSWQPGHRQTHRMDLFRYPGFGPPGRYPEEILHQLPSGQDLVFFNELTHWRYSQNGYIQAYPRADFNGDRPPHWNDFLYERRPDAALTMVYDRLTFFAWPRYYHWFFNQTMRYGIGDVTHSSGTHDHFNQWLWQRLLWAPQSTVEDAVAEYARAWFGPEAAPLMAQAIFQLEDNLAEKPGVPITKKEGIDRYYRLVHEAGAKMPPLQMKNNWLWREYMQKAALDEYVQLSVRQQTELQTRIEKAVAGLHPDAAIDHALAWLAGLHETPEMAHLRQEATHLGNESDRLFGVRSEGIFNLDHDFIGLGWLKRQLQRARAASGAEKAELLHMITHYEDPGEGGFYDDAGTLDRCPDIVRGYPYDFGQPFVSDMLSEGNRPSQRAMHYTQDEDQGVTFLYRGLDPGASYRIRFTLVRPRYQDRYRSRMNQRTETIYAGDCVLARDLEVPERMSDFFTFAIPAEAIHNGELVVRFERAPDVARGTRVERQVWRNTGGWGTIVSEAWLMKCPQELHTSRTSGTLKPWKPQEVRQMNGTGAEIRLPAQLQVVTESWNRVVAVPYIIYMPEKDRLLMLVNCDYPHHAEVLFSDDRGASWSSPKPAFVGTDGKPVAGMGTSLCYLGEGNVLFYGSARWFSRDYGQTWKESVPLAPATDGKPWYTWDPPLVERDAKTGKIARLIETGYTWFKPPEVKTAHQQGYVRFSTDEGKSWSPSSKIPQWEAVSEVALLRAANGHLVAACRTDTPARMQPEVIDHTEGLGISISADDGQTWSEVRKLYDWGRHHPSLILLSSGDIVMTYVVRKGYINTPDGFPQFGIEAVVSRDHGQTWDLDHKYILHHWIGHIKEGPTAWYPSSQATSTVRLPDGSILTAFGTGYRCQDIVKGQPAPRDVGLIRWRLNPGTVNAETKLRDATFDSELRNVFNPERR